MLSFIKVGHADAGKPKNLEPLNILLTNDDGWDFVGIQRLRAALLNAGHRVLLVAPGDSLAGRFQGASLDFDRLVMEVVDHTTDPLNPEFAVYQYCDDLYVAPYEDCIPDTRTGTATPAQAVMVGFRFVRASLLNPAFGDIDMVISGTNDLTATAGYAIWSGTRSGVMPWLKHINAQTPVPTISVAANANGNLTLQRADEVAEFVVGLVTELQKHKKKKGQLLPDQVGLHIAYPDRDKADVKGVKMAVLGRENRDTTNYFYGPCTDAPDGTRIILGVSAFEWDPDFDGPFPPLPAGSQAFLAFSAFTLSDGIEDKNADDDLMCDGYIAIVPVKDYTANNKEQDQVKDVLEDLLDHDSSSN